jgi:predicted SnoaL-like aldol condensation-catalyzing enzyme
MASTSGNDLQIENSMQERKQAAVEFLQLVVAGRIDEAYQKHVDMQGKHHNPFFPAGFPALKKGMMENHVQFPNKQLVVKNVLGDGDLVAVHSHIVPPQGEKGMAVVYLFRFQDGKIVEMWDCGQPLPTDSPNKDGAF